MSHWMQTLIVVVAIVLCGAALLHQLYAVLRGKPSIVGKCCSKGCGQNNSPRQAGAQKNDAAETRTHFIPLDALKKHSR